MAKKKTRVLLPGGIQNLVHDLQNGGSRYAQMNVEDGKKDAENEVADEPTQQVENQANKPQSSQEGTIVAEPVGQEAQEADKQQNRVGENSEKRSSATPAENREKSSAPVSPSENANGENGENTVGGDKTVISGAAGGEAPKEYHIVKDDSNDSWQLFLDMAKQYRNGDGKLATIYIDSTLKNVLDRMKYAGPEKLSTSAILSSIVARFIYDHEEDIRKVLFSGKLI